MYGSMHLRAHNRCHGYTIATIAKVYSDISYSTHHIIDKFLNGIVVTDIDLVEVNGEVYIPPHVVIVFNMAVESTGTTLKLMASQTADEANTLLILLGAKLQGKGIDNHQDILRQWPSSSPSHP